MIEKDNCTNTYIKGHATLYLDGVKVRRIPIDADRPQGIDAEERSHKDKPSSENAKKKPK